MELKFAHSHKALLLRKALQEDSSRELFLQFLSTRNTSDSKLVADVEFWLEVQRFKVIITWKTVCAEQTKQTADSCFGPVGAHVCATS